MMDFTENASESTVSRKIDYSLRCSGHRNVHQRHVLQRRKRSPAAGLPPSAPALASFPRLPASRPGNIRRRRSRVRLSLASSASVGVRSDGDRQRTAQRIYTRQDLRPACRSPSPASAARWLSRSMLAWLAVVKTSPPSPYFIGTPYRLWRGTSAFARVTDSLIPRHCAPARHFRRP